MSAQKKIEYDHRWVSTLPDEWIWDSQPTGKRLEILLQHYNVWLEIQFISNKLHDYDEF